MAPEVAEGSTHRLRVIVSSIGSLLVVAAAAAASALVSSAEVRSPLEAAAAIIVVCAMTQRWSQGLLDGLLVGAGGVLVALVLIGLLLDIAPGGLARLGWTISVAVLEAVIIVLARPVVAKPPGIRLRAVHALYLVGVVLMAAGFVASVWSTEQADRAPLALSVRPFQGHSTVVSITDGIASGQLQLVESVGRSQWTLLTDFEVSPIHPKEIDVEVPDGQRTLVRLVSEGVTKRELILEGR